MSKLKSYLLPLAFLQAVIAMAGSLFFSEVWGLVPCVLCWYQRITMYPLVVIAFVAMWRKDDHAYLYALPLSIIGFCISLYHNILYYAVNWGIRPDWTGPCQAGVSCTTRYIEWAGFITIPLLSLVAHLVITVLMVMLWRAANASKKDTV
jgi:disulfide bond formation protein DsbB